MTEKLTILIQAKHKKFIKQYARQQNKSVSKLVDDLFASLERKASSEKLNAKDDWLEKAAGIYTSGRKDVLKELFKAIKK